MGVSMKVREMRKQFGITLNRVRYNLQNHANKEMLSRHLYSCDELFNMYMTLEEMQRTTQERVASLETEVVVKNRQLKETNA